MGSHTIGLMAELFICDAQVHAPRVEPVGRVSGIDVEPLLAEMATAGVDRAVLVPLSKLGNPADNADSLALAREHPDRFAVMGLIDLARGPLPEGELARRLAEPGMLGFRVAAFNGVNRDLMVAGELEWLWTQAEAAGAPIMLLANGLTDRVDDIAARHPGLRLVLDHMCLDPFATFSEAGLLEALRPVNALAAHPNVAIKASSAPGSVAEPYPFPSLHEPLRQLIAAWGPRRVFWGSDMTRLPCPYSECVRLFTEALEGPSREDLEWIMGRALCAWLDWPI
jgi:predicted TIM-barrel fold metal-dependent hydrolase